MSLFIRHWEGDGLHKVVSLILRTTSAIWAEANIALLVGKVSL